MEYKAFEGFDSSLVRVSASAMYRQAVSFFDSVRNPKTKPIPILRRNRNRKRSINLYG